MITIKFGYDLIDRLLKKNPTLNLTYTAGVINHENCWIPPTGLCAYSQASWRRLDYTYLRRGPQAAEIAVPCPEYDRTLSKPQALETATLIPYVHYTHFGKLLTETVGNNWHLPSIQTDHDITDVIIPSCYAKSISWMKTNINPKLNYHNSASFVDGVHIKRLLVAQPTMVNRYAIAPDHFHYMRNFIQLIFSPKSDANPSIATASKIYLSRSRLPFQQRRIHGESELEAELKQNGWQIVHPQELSMQDQLTLLKHADVISGCIGSAFHLLGYFVNEGHLQEKLVLPITTIKGDYVINYLMQFYFQKIPFHFLYALEMDPDCEKKAATQDLIIPCPPKHLTEALESAIESHKKGTPIF